MKDVIDVSRSYYALKGQLPSVPFRDYAYDRHGNKVKIEPEVTDPAASFGASRRQTNIDRSSTNGINEATQDAPTVESKALKDLTTSDLNGRRIGPIRTSRAQSSRKKNFTDGDVLRPMPTLSADKPTEPKANADPGTHAALPASTTLIPDARAGTATRMSQPRTRPYQPYVEDYPETPKPRHRRVDFKDRQTPEKMPLARLPISTRVEISTSRMPKLQNHQSKYISRTPRRTMSMASHKILTICGPDLRQTLSPWNT